MITLNLLSVWLVLAGPLAPLPNPAPAPAPAAFTPAACDASARAIRRAARYEAYADFWIRVAACANEHGHGHFSCLREAWSERREALELAQDQYDARIDLCARLGHGPYNPVIDPANFTTTINNQYLPLVPGRTLVYEKVTAEGLERIEVTTLSHTVELEGVECVAVRDVATLDGEVIEDTEDWYVQDLAGNVWYFGEIAQNFEDGLLDNLDGSWRYGKDSAQPGMIMKSIPTPGDIYRQELLFNEAEDIGEVISLGETVTVPAGHFTNCVQTEDTTPLEPDVLERKFYAPGIGLVLEVDPDSGERTELVQIIN